mgnify:CR=1 FL=1
MLDEILGGMDKELSAMLRAEYAKKGIKFLLSTKVVGVSKGRPVLLCHTKMQMEQELLQLISY